MVMYEAQTELLEALKAEALDTIKYCTGEIGFYLKEKEASKDTEATQLIDYLIWRLRYKIEENYNDIERWRTYQKPC